MSKRRKVKEILRAGPDGKVTNFGFLMVGYIANRQVLAASEVLLLMGARITQEKPGDWFFYDESLVVQIKDRSYRLFTAKRSDMVPVGNYLFGSKKFQVKQQNTFSKEHLLTWEHVIVPEAEPAAPREPLYQPAPSPAKRSILRRWLDAFFSKGKNNELA